MLGQVGNHRASLGLSGSVSNWEFLQRVVANSSSEPDREEVSGKQSSQVNKVDNSVCVCVCVSAYIYVFVYICLYMYI